MTERENDTPAATPTDIEALLQQQAQALDDIFHKYREHAVIGKFSEDRIHVALRAQAQCQATARTLRQWQEQSKDKP